MQPLTVEAFRPAQCLRLGSVVLTIPRGAMDAKAWTSLDHVVAADLAGLSDLTERLRAGLERRLGVTNEDRHVAGTLDPLAMASEDIERLDAAESNLRVALAPTHGLTGKERGQRHKQRCDARLALLDLQRDHARRIERAGAVEVVRGIAETVSLSKPGSLSVETVAGKPRARRIGGFLAALDRGVLDGCKVSAEALYRMGELYRELYEIAIGQRGPDRENMTGGGGSRVPVVAIEAGEKLSAMRTNMAPLQVGVLDIVCGHDCYVYDAATQLRRKPATIETVLCQALEIAGANKGAWSV